MKTSISTNAEKDVLLYRNNSLAVGITQPQRGRTVLKLEEEIMESEQKTNVFESIDGLSKSQSLDKYID
jgi:hypothetical protein